MEFKKKKPFCINGYKFTFEEKGSYEYTGPGYRYEQKMTDYYLYAAKIGSPSFSYNTIADYYCINGVVTCGDTLTLPSTANEKTIEGIVLQEPFSIYDENIKTIIIGSQMHTVPVSTLNMVFPNLEAFVVGSNNPYIAQIDGCLYNKKAKTLIACPATKTELVIPEGIVGIEHFACQYAKELTKVEIPSTCTIIGTSAFEECTSLKEIKFAESSCWVIEEKAFNGCTNLNDIDLSATLCVEIESNAFSGCTNLTKLQLPSTLKKIGNNAFENSPLKEIILPDGLEIIGKSVFGSNLRTVVIPANAKEFYPTSFTPYCMVSVASGNKHYYEKDGVVFTKANELFFYPYNAKKDTAYEIPNGTTAILCSLGNQIKELTIPSSVSKITVELPSGSKLHVDSGSHAESYAIEKHYNYESKIVESNDLDWLYAPQENTTAALELLETQLLGQPTKADNSSMERDAEQGDLLHNNSQISSADTVQENSEATSETSQGKKVEIPAGTYTIGEDIPAGTYTVSVANEKQTVLFEAWRVAVGNYNNNGSIEYCWLKKDNPQIGKIVLENKNVVCFGGPVVFEQYKSLKFQEKTPIPAGTYTIGEDIPAGTYTVSLANEKQTVLFEAWRVSVGNYNNGGNIEYCWLKKENPLIGKIVLENKNVVRFGGPVVFEQYKGFSF